METLTVTDTLSGTIVVAQTPSDLPPVQVSETDSESSQTAWMVVTILLLVTAIVAVVIIVILGCILYQKINAHKRSSVITASSSVENIKPKNKGMLNILRTLL